MNSIALKPNRLIATVLAVASIGVAVLGPDDAEARQASDPVPSLSSR